MARRSHEDWVALIQQQSASGLTITAFCRLHKLSISGFYARKADIAKMSIPTGALFVKATLASPTAMATQAQLPVPEQTIFFSINPGYGLSLAPCLQAICWK
ncbi:IS66 family insertion sequence element accessory protein TnpB [Shewanella sp. MEBiC00475]|uniref:IS66 family insertion sequence element accessory protein TnpA n=1 Tax=Shewanella sp. MEBiC00475 TaxID=2575361 RepID=UPI0020C78087|nr:IS66 family insertion sequence element accessory protein TnpB [Shewanella sp. MEBiC00475]